MRFSAVLSASVLSLVFAAGCSGSAPGAEGAATEDPIVDVPHTPVERQSIGNCWIYSMATWTESMHLAATGQELDVSQSYWTYWHWYDQVSGGWSDEISTGGQQYVSNDLARTRGIVAETDFVAEDAASEMSSRQSSALAKINDELKNGRLKDRAARRDGAIVRQVLDEAWGLKPEVTAWMTSTFGADGRTKLRAGAASPEGTPIVSAAKLPAQYTRRTAAGATQVVKASLEQAMNDWRDVSYPTNAGQRRTLLQRVQRALHDRQPVVITWNVDFNAMESGDNDRRGSFNLTTLEEAGGAGRQGGHMTVMEDYEAELANGEVLKAGVTLDPNKAEDKAKLDAALATSTKIKFIRVKNSWGAFRDDRSSAPGFPGYHDLYMDYMNGPIAWCPDRAAGAACNGSSTPMRKVMLPPGY